MLAGLAACLVDFADHLGGLVAGTERADTGVQVAVAGLTQELLHLAELIEAILSAPMVQAAG
eukprot:6223837-Alexandrium_andersonii.AAC.1